MVAGEDQVPQIPRGHGTLRCGGGLFARARRCPLGVSKSHTQRCCLTWRETDMYARSSRRFGAQIAGRLGWERGARLYGARARARSKAHYPQNRNFGAAKQANPVFAIILVPAFRCFLHTPSNNASLHHTVHHTGLTSPSSPSPKTSNLGASLANQLVRPSLFRTSQWVQGPCLLYGRGEWCPGNPVPEPRD